MNKYASMLIISASLAGAGCATSTQQVSTFGALSCDSSLADTLPLNEHTSFITAHHFKSGEKLALTSEFDAETPVAQADMCMVKLLSTPEVETGQDLGKSNGIGIEVWLPTLDKWSGRLHAEGGGGYAGGKAASADAFSEPHIKLWDIASRENAVAVHSDFGHQGQGFDGTFLANSDGTVNTATWQYFAHLGIYEMTQNAKNIAKAFYGKPVTHAFFRGGSTGGRQGLKIAQKYPLLFDGIIADFPAINWSRFITSELYPQIAFHQALNGKNIPKELITRMSNAAIEKCSSEEGHQLGYLLRPDRCSYDPTQDSALLCSSGANPDSCVTRSQAEVMNQIWYGMTANGAFPEPAESLGTGVTLEFGQMWFGLPRGSNYLALAGDQAFPIATTQVALQAQDLSLADPFVAPESGKSKWQSLSYEDLAALYKKGIEMQASFAEINTDDTDLSAFKEAGGKIITIHGLADELISSLGTVRYYNQVAEQLGGLNELDDFYAFYLIPGMSHGYGNGTSNPQAKPVVPANDLMYEKLVAWVEEGTAPGEFTLKSAEGFDMPVCTYPKRVYATNDGSGERFQCQ